MNCECIYYRKGATKEELLVLADDINRLSVELDPVAISIMKAKTEVATDYDAWEKPFNIPENSLVLFVYGKYHYMVNKHVGRKVFKACFPTDYDIEFEDIMGEEDLKQIDDED